MVALVGLVGAASLLGACSDAPEQDELIDALVRSGYSTAEAECAAEALYGNLPEDEIAAIAERGPSAVIDDPKITDEPIDIARSEIAACRTSTSEVSPGRARPWWSAGGSSFGR